MFHRNSGIEITFAADPTIFFLPFRSKGILCWHYTRNKNVATPSQSQTTAQWPDTAVVQQYDEQVCIFKNPMKLSGGKNKRTAHGQCVQEKAVVTGSAGRLFRTAGTQGALIFTLLLSRSRETLTHYRRCTLFHT